MLVISRERVTSDKVLPFIVTIGLVSHNGLDRNCQDDFRGRHNTGYRGIVIRASLWEGNYIVEYLNPYFGVA